ncbi:MAG: AraC family transcriptional regulator [Lachnospiraceae bacterium]
MDYSHELILPNDDIPFKLFLFEGKDGNYIRDKHWHRSVEIFALFEGEISFYLNEKEYNLKSGEFILVNSNEIHSIHSPRPNCTVVLQIPLDSFEKYYTQDRFIYFSHSARIQDDEVMRLVREIYQTYVQHEIGYELKVQGQFYQLMYLLVTKYRKTEVSEEIVRQNKGLNKLSEITAYMKENYTKEITLEGVAKIFAYSPTYLSRMFRKYARTNYKAYLDQIRLEHAFVELANSRTPIGEIAMNHGFANSKSFAKVFQKQYGMLPSEYRNNQEAV